MSVTAASEPSETLRRLEQELDRTNGANSGQPFELLVSGCQHFVHQLFDITLEAIVNDDVSTLRHAIRLRSKCAPWKSRVEAQEETDVLLTKCVLHGSTNCARYYLTASAWWSPRADPNFESPPPGLVPPLYSAAAANNDDMLRLLLEHGADIHVGAGEFSNGPTALFGAVMNKRTEAARSLLEHGGPVEHVDRGLEGALELLLVARKAYRTPVEIFKHDGHALAGDDAFSLVLAFPNGVSRDWLKRLRTRKPDRKLVTPRREIRKPDKDVGSR